MNDSNDDTYRKLMTDSPSPREMSHEKKSDAQKSGNSQNRGGEGSNSRKSPQAQMSVSEEIQTISQTSRQVDSEVNSAVDSVVDNSVDQVVDDSPILGRPVSFYITEKQNRDIDRLKVKLQDNHTIKKLHKSRKIKLPDRSAVVRALLGNIKLSDESFIRSLVDKLTT